MRSFNSRHVPRPSLDELVVQRLERGDLDLEIGAGQGLHAVRYAQANPKRTLIAIERTRIKFEKLSQRRAHHPELKNLIPLHADAVSVVTHFIADESLNRVILLYPNPYPKPKQANLRWHNSPFLSLLIQRLKPGGEILLATNLKWYAEEARKSLQEEWQLNLLSEQELVSPEQARTHFEKKYLERGETCFDFIFVKPRRDK